MNTLALKLALALGLLASSIAASVAAGDPGQLVANAQALVETRPDDARAYIALAQALTRRAREGTPAVFYGQADTALAAARARAPADPEAEKVAIEIDLGRHRYEEALQRALALNRKVPDDVLVYGFLVDANGALGRYQAAEAAAQWMLNLRPGNIPGLLRAAYLRQIYGDLEGAADLLDQAYRNTPEIDLAERASMLARMSALHRAAGRLEVAEEAAGRALTLIADYPEALDELAAVRRAQGHAGEALRLRERGYQRVADPRHLYALAVALRAAGRAQDARKAFREFDQQAASASGADSDAARELVYYYADVLHRPRLALEVAQREIARRQDIHTRAAHAWALHANGRREQARRAMGELLSLGTRDPDIRDLALRMGVTAAAPGASTRRG